MKTVVEELKIRTGLETIMRAWIPEQLKSVIVGIHGFAEHTGRYENVGTFLVSRGYALYMYDLRGHGRSKSTIGYIEKFEEFLEDTEAFVEYVRRLHSTTPIFLMGHSMGGLIVTYYAGFKKSRLSGLITSGAALELEANPLLSLLVKLQATLRPNGRVKLTVNTNCLSSDKEVVKKYIEDPLVFKDPTFKLLLEFNNATSKVWEYVNNISIPTLIMHGAEDCIVPKRVSEKLYAKLKVEDKTLKIYEGMKHEIFNEIEKEKPLKDLVDWISKHKLNSEQY